LQHVANRNSSSRPGGPAGHGRAFFRAVFLAGLGSLGLGAADAGAALRAARMFSDRMVLQREIPAPVWGWADPGDTVAVAFAGQTQTAVADAAGRWMVRLEPLPASAESRELSITVAAKNRQVVLRDVVVGDVWLCSGQSNMEMGVHEEFRKTAPNDPLLRNIYIHPTRRDEPIEDLSQPTSWTLCRPNALHGWSGAAYHAGLALREELGVPVGLINSSVGGTGALMWIGRPAIDRNPEYKAVSDFINSRDPRHPDGKAYIRGVLAQARTVLEDNERAVEGGGPFKDWPVILPLDPRKWGQCPTVTYNAAIHPLIPYAIRGLFWYHGEQDANGQPRPTMGRRYVPLLKMLIGSWREAWGQGDFPVVVVQLPNCFGPPDPNRPEGEYWWNLLREAQEIAVREIPRTSLVVTIDVGGRDVHPRNKVDVGRRMARTALVHVYGLDLLPGGPLYRKHAVEGSRIRVFFDQAGDGLMVATKDGFEAPVEEPAGALKHFVIAGEDRKWHWADAAIDGDTVVVSSPAVPEPVAVRFAFFQNPEGFNFYNRNSFPAAPFRTDDWPDGIPTPDESIDVWYQGPL
jgi:sialate O-acetylesterase